MRPIARVNARNDMPGVRVSLVQMQALLECSNTDERSQIYNKNRVPKRCIAQQTNGAEVFSIKAIFFIEHHRPKSTVPATSMGATDFDPGHALGLPHCMPVIVVSASDSPVCGDLSPQSVLHHHRE